jgi:hypothetical protein
MIRPQQVALLGLADCVVARGVVAIDTAEGAPTVIIWEGEAYVMRLAGGTDELCYRKTRVFYAGASFEAVR